MKNKVKKFFAKHGGKVFFGTLITLVIGIVSFCLGGYLAGWNIVGWLTSPSAMFVYAFVLLFLLFVLWLWFFGKRGMKDE